jgi:hypothetical protein
MLATVIQINFKRIIEEWLRTTSVHSSFIDEKRSQGNSFAKNLGSILSTISPLKKCKSDRPTEEWFGHKIRN